MNGKPWPLGVVPKGSPMTQAARDAFADALESGAYWATAGGDRDPREALNNLTRLVAFAVRMLREGAPYDDDCAACGGTGGHGRSSCLACGGIGKRSALEQPQRGRR